MKSHRRFVPPARSLTLVALLVVAVLLAPTGHAQEPEPAQDCVDFSDWPVGGDVGPRLTHDGLAFTANEDEQLSIVEAASRSGLLVPRTGVEIRLPWTTPQVVLRTVSGTREPLQITAYDSRDSIVDQVDAPSEPQGIVHTVTVVDEDITVLQLRGGGNEGVLVEICIQAEPATPTRSPTPTRPPTEPSPPPGTPSPTPSLADQCDLSLTRLRWAISEDDVLVFTARVVNVGDERVGPTVVRAWTYAGWRGQNALPALSPDESDDVNIRLGIIERRRGFFHTFNVEVDPEHHIDDPNCEDKRRTIRVLVPKEPTPTPTPEAWPDLRLYDTDSYIEGDDLLVITAQVENVGDEPAPATTVRAESDGWDNEADVPPLRRGESVEVRVMLPILDEARGETYTFTVEVDPDRDTGDLRRGNNLREVEVKVPDGGDFRWLIILALGGFVAIVGVGTLLGVRYRIKIGGRREWQEKAEEEKPAEPCQPCTRYCRVSGMEVELALRKITHLTLVAQDPDSGEKSGEKEVKGQVVDHLNAAVGAHRRRPEPDKLQSLMRPVAGTLLQDIAEWLRPGPVPRDVSVAAHLEGGKVTVQFVLYHCRRKGNLTTWEPEDKWKATVKDERDEPVATLRRLDPAEPGVPERVLPELTQRLMRFVEEVSA